MLGWHLDVRIVSFLEFYYVFSEDSSEFLNVFNVEGLVEGIIKSHFVHVYGFCCF